MFADNRQMFHVKHTHFLDISLFLQSLPDFHEPFCGLEPLAAVHRSSDSRP